MRTLDWLARGAGFEPARPVRTTGLAGLPPTRLGQPRTFMPEDCVAV